MAEMFSRLNPGGFMTNLCASQKLKAICAKQKALLTCHAKAEKRGVPLSSLCIFKAQSKFIATINKIDAKGGCQLTGDAAALEVSVDAFVDDVVCHLHPASGTCPAATPKPTATSATPTMTPIPTRTRTPTPTPTPT